MIVITSLNTIAIMASQRSDPFFSLPILLFTHHVGQTTVQQSLLSHVNVSKTEEESPVVCQYHTGTIFVLHCLFFNIYVAETIKFDFLLHFPAP